jgi:hypothetical protein
MSEFALIIMDSRNARTFSKIGFVLVALVVPLIGLYSYYSLRYFNVSEKCALDPTQYNVTHPYDCTKFTPGSIAERCAQDPKQYKLSNIAGCSRFLPPA